MNKLDLAIAHRFNRDNQIESFVGMTEEEVISNIKLHILSGVDIYEMYGAYYKRGDKLNPTGFFFKDAISYVNKIVDKYKLPVSYKL